MDTLAKGRIGLRPLFLLALCVVLGAGLGASDALSLALARGAVPAALALWLGALLVRAGAASARGALLLLCASIAAFRAAEERVLAERADSLAPEGTIADVRGADVSLVRVAPSTRTYTLPRGLVAPGEGVVLDPVRTATEWARGPVEGPRRRSGVRPPLEVGPDEVVRTQAAPAGPARWVASGGEALRAAVLARTSDLRDPLTRALVQALLAGETSELPPDLPDLFVRTGTFHVLAVSGMQVVLVLVCVVGPLSSFGAAVLSLVSRGRWRRTREWFALPLLAAFVPIAGGGAPIVRSALSGLFGLVAPRLAGARPTIVGAHGRTARVRLSRRADALSCWSLALILECMLHPRAPTSLSVQLSYAATFGLITLTGPCLALVRAALGLGRAGGSLFGRVSRTGRPRSPWLVVPPERALHGLACAIAASCAAVLATLPFVWPRTGEWSPWGVLATPLLGPPMAGLFVGGWIHVLAPPLVPEVLIEACARTTVAAMHVFDALPWTPAPLPPRPAGLVALAAVFTGLALRVGRRSGPARLAAVAWAVVIVPWRPAPARVVVHALDVGAGTAVVIEGPGIGTWVFDAGSRDRPDVAREALGPLLARLEPGRVNVVLSHADRDHDGALAWLVERYPPRAFTGARPTSVASEVADAGPFHELAHGELVLVDTGDVRMVLQRARQGEASDNEASHVLEILAAGQRLLLFGDAEAEGLDAWIARHGTGASARLVLWPHHGSETDRLDALVRALRPAEVWISASGRPASARELARRGIRTRVTAREGPLEIALP